MGASRAYGAGPGYPLVSFLPLAKKDTASIPCAEEKERRRKKNHHGVARRNTEKPHGHEGKVLILTKKES
jgi:hypothetical protein